MFLIAQSILKEIESTNTSLMTEAKSLELAKWHTSSTRLEVYKVSGYRYLHVFSFSAAPHLISLTLRDKKEVIGFRENTVLESLAANQL